jgi:cell filamentation protein
VTFDPFGDLATKGYLRNVAGEKDLTILRRLEHSSFVTGLQPAFEALCAKKTLTYDDVLSTHKILFEAVYPWAGEDRVTNFPDKAVVKGKVVFAHPKDIRGAIDYALKHGQDRATMKAKPGMVMGYLAYGHPFLDGNGRTIMAVHAVLAQRAGFSIDWSKTEKNAYLAALTNEIDAPNQGHLDTYLAPFHAPPLSSGQLADAMGEVSGLAGDDDDTENKVLGATDDPVVKAKYEQHQLQRGQAQSSN